MSLRERTRPGLGIIEPCLPFTREGTTERARLASRDQADGFRICATICATICKFRE